MLSHFGWSRGLQREFAAFAARELLPGRVLVQHRGRYRLVTEVGETEARLAGRFRHGAADGGYPVTGDWVAIQADATAGFALIHDVVPRRTAFVRKDPGTGRGLQVVAANVDVALLMLSLNADFNPRRLERYLAATHESGASPIVVLSKADACPDPAGQLAGAQAVAGDAPVIAVSALDGQGLKALHDQLEPGRTAVLLGSSGVGKSTLVNALCGNERMATAAIRDSDQKGRHTTTHRELIRLPSGALILDTPGMRELGLMDAEAGVAAVFGGLAADVDTFAEDCRFRDCRHEREPGCAVQAALAAGRLDLARYEGWQKLQRELHHERLKADPLAREEERRAWIAVMKSARAHMKDKRRVE